MLTSKQRAYLRAKASKLDAIFQIGKGGISDVLADEIAAALEKRELVKITVLESAGVSARAAAATLSEMIGAEAVAAIGTKAVLYKKADKPIYQLPRAKE